MTKVSIVYGTRPEAIKIAPVARTLRESAGFEVELISTGQHREMLAPVEEIFSLRPSVDLGLMKHGQSLSELFGRVVAATDDVFAERRPQLVIVHGDTTTAAAAALAGFHRQIPVAHLEAGLRSGELGRPFPEEGNRQLISRVARLHLAPTGVARENLLREGIGAHTIAVTGNTVIDALHWARQQARFTPWPSPLATLDGMLEGRKLVVVTLHRRENLASAVGTISRALAELLRAHEELVVVFPMHHNPAVRSVVRAELGMHPRAVLTEPVDYLTMVKLLDAAWTVVTDSGGLQEEAPAFGVPVLVARETTERPEAIDAGVAELIGADGDALTRRIDLFLAEPERWEAMAKAVNPFGDGRAALRVREAVTAFLRDDGDTSERVTAPGEITASTRELAQPITAG